jgi:hypothetical protein
MHACMVIEREKGGWRTMTLAYVFSKRLNAMRLWGNNGNEEWKRGKDRENKRKGKKRERERGRV